MSITAQTAVRTLRQPLPYVYAFALGPAAPPIARVVPGETVAVEVGDEPGDAAGADWFSARTPRRPPLASPIRVEGAEPGDLLAVSVLSVDASAGAAAGADGATAALVGLLAAAPAAVAPGDTVCLAVERPGAELVLGGAAVDGRAATGRVRVVVAVDLVPGRRRGKHR